VLKNKSKKIINFFFFLFLFSKLLFSCYYNNYYPNKDITCISGRDYNVFDLEDNLSLESYIPYSLGISKLILTKKNGKNTLIAAKYYLVNSETPKKWSSVFYIYDINQKKFKYLGTFSNGFISDVDNNNNYEIIFQNFLTNQLVIKENLLNSFNLRENETLYWVKDNYITTYLNINETNFNLTFYKFNGNSLSKYLELNLEKSKFQDLFIYKDNIYILYEGYWYLVNSEDKENWENQVGYLRFTKYHSFVVNQLPTKYISILDLSLTKELNFESDQDPLFTISNFNGKEYIFLLNNLEKELYIYDSNKNLVKSFVNVSYFSVNNQKLFLVKDKELYYTTDFYHLYLFFNDSTTKIKEVYLYDYDNDGKSEIEVLLNDGRVYLYNEQSLPDVDYYVKKIEFPEPYITYSKYFNVTICSKGSQIIPFNLSISIENNNTKIPIEKEFLSQFLGVNTCKTYKIDYIPFKQGIVTINVSLDVNDKNILNNHYSTKKEVIHDYWFVNKDFSKSGFQKEEEGFLAIDEDDNLLNGYEKFEFVNLDNCTYKKVDYNKDNIKEYLIDCDYSDNYKLLDPLNKKIYDAKIVKDEDFTFFVGLINSTNFFVILPWDNYSGYIANITKNQFGDILEIDYDLDNINDFLTYKSAFSIYGKQLTDFSYLTSNLRIRNPKVSVSLDNNSFLITLNFNLEYKGLFNESGEVGLNYLGKETTIPISNDYNLLTKIPLKQTPLTAFSSLPLSFELKEEKFNNFEISLNYEKQYNKTDDKIKLKYCDLLINKVDLNNSFIEINKSGNCSESIHLIVKGKDDLGILDIYINNDTNTYYISDLPLSNRYSFFIYQDNTLDKDYSNNKVFLTYDILKLIHLNFQTENIVLYNQNNIKFNIKCDKEVELNMELNCSVFNKTETFRCNSEGKEFNYEITPFEKFKCYLTLKNKEFGLNIKKEYKFKFEFPNALEKFNLDGKAITIIEVNGEKKALLGKELKEVNFVNIDQDSFQSVIKGKENALNIYNVEIPNYLKFVKVEADQPVKIDEKGNRLTIKTFANEIKIITKSLEKLNESEKEKFGVVEETDVVKNNESFNKIIKLIVLLVFFFSLVTTIILSAYYYYTHIYLKKKAMLNEQKKMGYYYKLHKQKEEELLKKQKEELEKRKEAVIIEEAKKLVHWVRFLLEVYDEKEIYNYLLRKGYKKEVVDKAFELLKKGNT
jgi:hypothetical protein